MSGAEPKQSKNTPAQTETKRGLKAEGSAPDAVLPLFDQGQTTFSPQTIMRLQRTVGNQAVQRLLRGDHSKLVLPPIHHRQLTSNAGQRLIQRELAVQIQPEDDDYDTIKTVEIVGRPEGYWSDTMGDHTTAFIVHIESIRSRLKGQSIDSAIIMVASLVAAAKSLPGVEMAKNLEGGFQSKYNEALTTLNAIETNLTDAAHLQSYINAYLQFRELIPGSTVKTKSKTGYFGKGKGESGHAEKLVKYEMTEQNPAELVPSILGVFDSTGVGMMAVEANADRITEMSPGMDTKIEAVDRAKKVWEQHLQSIKMSFPKCYEAAKTDLATINVPQMIKAEVERDVEQDIDQVFTFLNLAVQYRANIGGMTAKTTKPELLAEDYYGTAQYRVQYDYWQDAIKEAGEWIERGEIQYKLLKKIDEHTLYKFDAGTLKGYLGQVKQSPTTAIHLVVPQKPAIPRKPKPTAPKKVEDKRGTKRKAEESDADTGPSKAAKGKAGATPKKKVAFVPDAKQPLAVQIKLADDNTVSEMMVGGRPPSPFAGTMGAHTTSWIVHLDHVRAYIIGKTILEAIDEVSEHLVQDAEDMYNEIGAKADIPLPHRYQLNEAKEALDSTKQTAEGTIHSSLFLQQYIQQLLTYINFIPNATLRKNDTTGHGEGTYRTTLMDYERSVSDGDTPPTERDTLKEAIVKLFDSSSRGPMWNNHLRIISKAYPNAFAKAGYTLQPLARELMEVM